MVSEQLGGEEEELRAGRIDGGDVGVVDARVVDVAEAREDGIARGERVGIEAVCGDSGVPEKPEEIVGERDRREREDHAKDEGERDEEPEREIAARQSERRVRDEGEREEEREGGGRDGRGVGAMGGDQEDDEPEHQRDDGRAIGHCAMAVREVVARSSGGLTLGGAIAGRWNFRVGSAHGRRTAQCATYARVDGGLPLVAQSTSKRSSSTRSFGVRV